MSPYWIAGGIALLFVLIFFVVLRFTNAPSLTMVKRIREELLALQAEAGQNVRNIGDNERRGETEQAVGESEMRSIGGKIRFGYTIVQARDRYVHTITSRLIASKPLSYQIRCMLIATTMLNQQIAAAAIDPKEIRFNISQSESGAHSLVMSLPSSAHVAMMTIQDPSL